MAKPKKPQWKDALAGLLSSKTESDAKPFLAGALDHDNHQFVHLALQEGNRELLKDALATAKDLHKQEIEANVAAGKQKQNLKHAQYLQGLDHAETLFFPKTQTAKTETTPIIHASPKPSRKRVGIATPAAPLTAEKQEEKKTAAKAAAAKNRADTKAAVDTKTSKDKQNMAATVTAHEEQPPREKPESEITRAARKGEATVQDASLIAAMGHKPIGSFTLQSFDFGDITDGGVPKEPVKPNKAEKLIKGISRVHKTILNKTAKQISTTNQVEKQQLNKQHKYPVLTKSTQITGTNKVQNYPVAATTKVSNFKTKKQPITKPKTTPIQQPTTAAKLKIPFGFKVAQTEVLPHSVKTTYDDGSISFKSGQSYTADVSDEFDTVSSDQLASLKRNAAPKKDFSFMDSINRLVYNFLYEAASAAASTGTVPPPPPPPGQPPTNNKSNTIPNQAQMQADTKDMHIKNITDLHSTYTGGGKDSQMPNFSNFVKNHISSTRLKELNLQDTEIEPQHLFNAMTPGELASLHARMYNTATSSNRNKAAAYEQVKSGGLFSTAYVGGIQGAQAAKQRPVSYFMRQFASNAARVGDELISHKKSNIYAQYGIRGIGRLPSNFNLNPKQFVLKTNTK